MKIIVNSEELKAELLEQSKYVHDYCYVRRSRKTGKLSFHGIDSDRAGILMHLYVNPEMITVSSENQ